jgi:hypothetical protein
MLRNKSHKSGVTSHKSQVLKIILFFLFIFGYDLQLTTCNLFAQEQFTYDAKGKRDPFIPLVTPDGRLLKLEKEETASGLLLEGIIYDEHGLSYCLVNGEVVRVSDKIGDYQVLKIEKNKVIFIKSGQTLEVELKEEGP